jgi:hypothetical protein
MLASLACVSLVWVSLGIFCGLVSYSAKLWGQSPDVLLPIVTTIVYGLIVGLPFGWPWPHGTFIGPFNIYLTHIYTAGSSVIFLCIKYFLNMIPYRQDGA